jgi:septin 3/9/12
VWQIRAELQQHGIKLYPFDSEELDVEEIQLNERIRVRLLLSSSHTNDGRLILLPSQNMIPFAVIGSEKTVVIDGQAVRGRKTRWATINVEDERHCEFVYLRNFLTR